jgi:hypothetical protein
LSADFDFSTILRDPREFVGESPLPRCPETMEGEEEKEEDGSEHLFLLVGR